MKELSSIQLTIKVIRMFPGSPLFLDTPTNSDQMGIALHPLLEEFPRLLPKEKQSSLAGEFLILVLGFCFGGG